MAHNSALRILVLIIVIQAGLKKVDVKGGVFLINAGVGRMTEPVSHRQGHLGGQGDVEAGSRLGGEVEGMGQGGAVNTLGNNPGATFDISQNGGKEEAARSAHGRNAQFKPDLIGPGDAGDAFHHERGSEGAPTFARRHEKDAPTGQQAVKVDRGLLGVFAVQEAQSTSWLNLLTSELRPPAPFPAAKRTPPAP